MNKDFITQKAKDNIEKIIARLFPKARKDGKRFYIGNIQGDEGDSLIIEAAAPKTGLWHDFATNEGGDILSLWAKATGSRDFKQVLSDISAFLSIPADTDKIPAGVWIYKDQTGTPILKISRYNTAKGKVFYPYDMKTKKHALPAVRPLYNLPLIAKEHNIIFSEGEKCAEAITGYGFCGTTALGGANTPLDKTDFSPLSGKSVLIWPDNDVPGFNFGINLYHHLKKLGIDAKILEIPEGKPTKWDAADAAKEGFDIKGFIETAARYEPQAPELKKTLQIKDWQVGHFSATPADPSFLIDNIIPLGVVSMLAAVGDTGKSMLLLDLAVKVATGQAGFCLGGKVKQTGAAVLFLAEDDMPEVERRLRSLDPEKYRYLYPERLFILPLPSISGAFAIVEEKPEGIQESKAFKNIKEQIRQIENLKLIAFDPLASFVRGDITFNSTVAAFLMNSLSQLAADTGASVIITHHLRKTNGEIAGIDDVREAIRGTSALVNGVRLAYAFWPLPACKQKDFYAGKDKISEHNNLYYGAVVKANSKVDRTINTYQRNPKTGLLELTQGKGHFVFDTQENENVLLQDLARLNQQKINLAFSGKDGIFEKRLLLSYPLKNLSKRNLRAIVSTLLDSGKITKGPKGYLTVENLRSEDEPALPF